MEKAPVFLGVSSAHKQIEEDLTFAARSDAKVLLTGESGVGKEVVAQLIHHRSSRRHGPLVTINCAGVPDTLLASELFGHVRGSFTDAYTDKRGWLEQADRGTIFMDEVGEMSSQMQGLLLRFLENGEIQPVGSDRRRSVIDVRVITATNRRLIEKVEAKEFREDLYYRLNVIHIDLPPLRERPEDIPIIVTHFIRQFSARHGVNVPPLSEEVIARLATFPWPGNVRQLRNIAERLVVRSRGGQVTLADLPRELFLSRSNGHSQGSEPPRRRSDILFERMMAGETFWTVVHQPFMMHDITREDVREVVRRGLDMTNDSYKDLLSVFNLPQEDYKRVLNFLQKFQSYIPLSDIRSVQARVRPTSPAEKSAVNH
jgi:transcriptional regulator with PAS, ATPase and Fis domain